MRSVGIRELKRDASAIIDAVEAGETVIVTRRGKPVARLQAEGVPPAAQRLVEQGRLIWPSEPLRLPELQEPDGDGPPLSQYVIEGRR